jgi:hypothetical protein
MLLEYQPGFEEKLSFAKSFEVKQKRKFFVNNFKIWKRKRQFILDNLI